jgi:hypothetical protein
MSYVNELVSAIKGILVKTVVLCICLPPVRAHAESCTELSSGGMLYVPVYSNVYSGPKANPLQLATMLSVHIQYVRHENDE